jgi:FMN-dependent NADH-azoreductase
MSQKDIGACFEIKVDGKTRSYRDQKETAIEAAKYLKQRQPKVEVSVHDLWDNSVTVIDGETVIGLDVGAGGKR